MKGAIASSFIALLCFCVTCAQVTTKAPAETPTSIVVVSTEPPEFSIRIKHVRSSTSSITIEWSVPYNFEDDIDDYQITAQKNDSEAVLTSPSLLPNGTLYEIEDLVTNAEYHICITASFKSAEEPRQKCDPFKTLRIIRPDSILAVIIAVGYIILMVIIGIICWCCARRKMRNREEEAEDEQSGIEDEEELLKPQDGNNLLAPPPIYRPRNSIEEELPNIPYITPPLDELNREGVTNRKGYNSANNI